MPDDPGDFEDTPLYYEETENLAEELNLSPGDIVQARVVSRLSGQDSRLLLSLRGRQVVAASRLKVKPGDNLIVRVQSVTRPLELKIYEPHQALEKLSKSQLSGILQSMELEPTDQLLEAARQLLKEDIHLDGELLELTRSHWTDITGEQGEIKPGRFDALRFLHGSGAPVNGEALGLLGGYFSCGEKEGLWQPVFEGSNLVSPVDIESFMKLVKGLGIDLVRQFGKRPARAAKTVHARLLKKFKNGEKDNPVIRFLLGRLLELALGSLAGKDEFYLAIPFLTGGQVNELQLRIKIGKTKENWEIPDWSLSGYFPFENLGPVRFELNCSKRRLGSIFITKSSRTINKIKKNISGLLKSLEDGGYNVQFKFKKKDPEIPSGPLSGMDEIDQTGAGKVDFIA